MANHVHFSVEFHQINEAATAKLKELYSRIRTDGNYRWFSDIFVDGEELTYEETEKYAWTTEHIGPKWSYFEDYDESGFNGEAAWGAPSEGLVKLLEILEEHDPNIVTSMVYEDEMPNFVGADIYWGSEMYDGIEDEWEEIIDFVISESETLTPESYNADEGEWVDEEAEDTFRDEMWEVINDRLYEFVSEQVEYVKESIKEQENEELTG